MPRIARVAAGDVVQHALNRGNGRVRLFRKPGDYAAFVDLLGAALDRTPGVRLLGWWFMPNHWHGVLWPAEDGELSTFMRWLANTHVRRWRQHDHSVGQGHVYQGR
jgi:putative transposase